VPLQLCSEVPEPMVKVTGTPETSVPELGLLLVTVPENVAG
jgi:hypothetical protein